MSIINNIPSSNRNQFGYKSINSSAIHNENQKEVREEIIDLFNKYNALERVNTYQNEVTRIENDYIQSCLKYLKDKVDLLEFSLATLTPSNPSKMHVINTDSIITNNGYNTVIDKKAGVLFPNPIRKVSKCALFDSTTDSVFIPKGLNVDIIDSIGSSTNSVDHDIYAPFTLKEDLYWTRYSEVSSSVDQVGVDYIITLPEEIMTTNDINEIIVNPFNAAIKNISVRYGDSSKWVDVNHSLAISQGDTKFHDHNKIVRVIFPKQKANQIKITVATSLFTDLTSNTKETIYGLKSVAAFINDYDDFSNSKFEATVDIPSNGQITITNITPEYENRTLSYNDCTFELFEMVNGSFVKITRDFPFILNSNKIKVIGTYAKQNKESAIRGVVITYTVE